MTRPGWVARLLRLARRAWRPSWMEVAPLGDRLTPAAWRDQRCAVCGALAAWWEVDRCRLHSEELHAAEIAAHDAERERVAVWRAAEDAAHRSERSRESWRRRKARTEIATEQRAPVLAMRGRR